MIFVNGSLPVLDGKSSVVETVLFKILTKLIYNKVHMERAAGLLEAVRREARGSADYRLSLFDLQTACYQVLQRVLVDLGRSSEALLATERRRTRSFVDLLR